MNGLHMSAARAVVLEELDQLITCRSHDERAATLQRVTDLFLHTTPRLDQETRNVFDDVMERLVQAIEAGARAELSGRLAPLPSAPVNVVRRLARDDEIAVAGPVLRQSLQLTSRDLVEIAERKSQAHLLAISDRPTLERDVTDVLVDRGNDQVVGRVLSNPGASFSEHGLGTAMRRAESNGEFADLLALRTDIPPHVFCSLLARASAAVRKRLLAAAPPELRAEIASVVGKVSDRLAVGASEEKHDYAGAVRRLLLTLRGKAPGESDILDFARNAQFDDCVAAVSLYCKIPTEAVARMIASTDLQPVLILGKAAGFDWPTIRALLLLGGRRSAERLTEACASFNKLSADSARSMLNFWQSHCAPNT